MRLMTAVLTCMAIVAPMTHADDGGKGLAIAEDRKARDAGWGDSQAEITMILKNSQGETSDRQIRLKSLEVQDDGDKGLTIFDEPRDVEGTAFLNFSHVDKPDDQWLYLPALKRVKRISSKNKSGPFMGSEFAYEDMSSFEPEKYEFNFLRDEPCGGDDEITKGSTCHVLESFPKDEYSGYTRQITWLDTVELRPYKVEYYDRKNSLLKTLTQSEWKLYEDKYWRADEAYMENHQTGKSTTLVTKSLDFKTGLTEDDFSQASLKRAR